MAPTFSHIATTNSKLTPFFSTKLPRGISQRPPILKITTMFNQQACYWDSVEADINTHLLKSFPTTPPSVVTEPMRHLVFTAPRTIAPALCLAACELVGGQRNHAMDTACALRLMHAAAYTHGHLLKPKPKTKLSTYAEGIELLTGDGIFPFGYEMVARSEGADAGLILRVIIEIASAMGPQGMVEGQLMEAEGGGDGKMMERKEGRLSACGAACGALLGGGSENDVERMRRFGMNVGMMYGLLVCGEKGMEAAEAFRDLAILDLQDGFEEGKVDAVRRLVDLWHGKRTVFSPSSY